MAANCYLRGTCSCLTAKNPEIPEAERGTYKALAHPSVIAYLKKLRITTLELLPIQAFLTEPVIKLAEEKIIGDITQLRSRLHIEGTRPLRIPSPNYKKQSINFTNPV